MLKIDLTGKIAVVTGSAGQLGRVIAFCLAECGADVALHYHTNAKRAEQTRSRIEALGRRACVVQADITERSSVESMRGRIEEELGSVDILVNNAVSQYTPALVLDQLAEDYVSQFRSSAVQNVLMAQVFVPAMIKRRWGRIIAINTEVVMLNHAKQSAYAAGKRGLDGVLRVLAGEIGEHQITVNQVAPGWMISDRDRAEGTEKQEHYDKNVPLRRRGEDRDIAHAVAFLASDLAGFISGVFLPVCGGNVMPGI